MSRALKVGIGAGLFGLFVVVIFGGMSVLMAALICGVVTGLLGARADADADTIRDGIRNGLISGGSAGVILFLAAILRNVVIGPRVGIAAAPINQTLIVGLIS